MSALTWVIRKGRGFKKEARRRKIFIQVTDDGLRHLIRSRSIEVADDRSKPTIVSTSIEVEEEVLKHTIAVSASSE